jgi:hypothetical protein
MGTDGRLAFAEVWTGPDNSSMRVNFPYGQKGNQFSEIDRKFSLLGLWRWRRIAARHFGALCVAGVLISVLKIL